MSEELKPCPYQRTCMAIDVFKERDTLRAELAELKAHDMKKCPNCENCITDLRQDKGHLQTELTRLIEQRNREFSEATNIIHDRETELIIKNEELALKDEEIKALEELVDGLNECWSYGTHDRYDVARSRLAEVREGGKP